MLIQRQKIQKNLKIKIQISLIPTFQTNYTYPLKKQTDKFNNTLTPKFSLNLSTPHTKDVRKKIMKNKL